MRPFLFRLERLFRLRRSEEQESARALGRALRTEREHRESLDEAAGHLRRCSGQAAETPEETMSAGMLCNLALAVRAAANRAQIAANRHRFAEEAVHTERESLGQAQKNRRVLERLRERRHGEWSQEASRDEQHELDSQARRHREWRDRQ
jgi:flagellar FliJ protein